MLTEQTCALLNLMSGISDTCILRYPTTFISDSCKSIVAKIDLSKSEEDFEPIGLSDKINNLTSIISMMDKPSITRVNNILCIKDDVNKIETQFVVDSIDLLIQSEFKKEAFERIESAPTVTEFKLTTNDVARLKTAHNVYNELNDVLFDANKEQLSISLSALNRFNSTDNKFTIYKDATIDQPFSIAVSFDSLLRIPKMDYTVSIKKSERNNNYVLVCKPDKIDAVIVLTTLIR